MDICSIIRRNLYCSYMLEQMAANLITLYMDKLHTSNTKLTTIKTILNVLAIESKNHALYIEFVAKQNNLFEETDCSQLVGMPWTIIQKLLEELSSGRGIDLKEFIERQMWLEKAIGEETYHRIILPLIRKGIEISCIDKEYTDTIEIILSKIIDDEKWHEELLQLLLKLYS